MGAVEVSDVLDQDPDGVRLAAKLAEDLESLLGQAKLDGLPGARGLVGGVG